MPPPSAHDSGDVQPPPTPPPVQEKGRTDGVAALSSPPAGDNQKPPKHGRWADSDDRPELAPPRMKQKAPTAKFIAGSRTETNVQLGADGQLPALVLRETKQQDDSEDTANTTNPLLLIGVLCFSISLSVILLFVDTSATVSEGKTKAHAREQIKRVYARPSANDKPYQTKLREAIWAHNNDDFQVERRRYREVLDMLHSEAIRDLGGLTGMREAKQPPNDRHLEDLLGILLTES
jgi:hypothetical protein